MILLFVASNECIVSCGMTNPTWPVAISYGSDVLYSSIS